MKQQIKIRTIVTIAMIMAMAFPALSQSKKGLTDGDVAIEVIGQVFNPTPTSSTQCGFLSYINGIDNVFAAGAQNETTALFTFYNEATNTLVVNNGPQRTINRVGTFTIYLDTAPNGNFSNPDTFRDGMPIITGTYRHQVVLDTTDTTFTATFVLTITSVARFTLNNESYFLGKAGQKLRLTVFGRPNTAGATNPFVISGYIVGSDLTR